MRAHPERLDQLGRSRVHEQTRKERQQPSVIPLVLIVLYVNRPVIPETRPEHARGEHQQTAHIRFLEPNHIALPDQRTNYRAVHLRGQIERVALGPVTHGQPAVDREITHERER